MMTIPEPPVPAVGPWVPPPTVASLVALKEGTIGPDVPNLFFIVSTFSCDILLILSSYLWFI